VLPFAGARRRAHFGTHWSAHEKSAGDLSQRKPPHTQSAWATEVHVALERAETGQFREARGFSATERPNEGRRKIMLKNLSRGRVIGVWFVMIAVAMIASFIFRSAATPGTWALLFLISLIPPAVALVIWRGAPPPTVAEVLYAVHQQEGR
jgi:hypothetical protein